jgi:hypothetical protein
MTDEDRLRVLKDEEDRNRRICVPPTKLASPLKRASVIRNDGDAKNAPAAIPAPRRLQAISSDSSAGSAVSYVYEASHRTTLAGTEAANVGGRTRARNFCF